MTPVEELHHAWWGAMTLRISAQVVCGCEEDDEVCDNCRSFVAVQRVIEKQLRSHGEWYDAPDGLFG